MLLPSMEYLESGTTHAFRWCIISVLGSNTTYFTGKCTKKIHQSSPVKLGYNSTAIIGLMTKLFRVSVSQLSSQIHLNKMG